MEIKISAEIAKSRHPQSFQEFVSYLRNSETKSKNTPEEEFEYFYYWCIQIIGNGLDKITPSLKIKANRVSKYYPVEIPIEIQEILTARKEAERQEQLRISSLTPEQRRDEIEEALKPFKNMPDLLGFLGKRIR